MKKPIFFCLFLLVFISSPAVYSAAQKTNLDTLIEKGELLVAQGSYETGIAVLERALKKDSKNSRILNSLLSACEAYTKKLSEAGRFKQAEVYLNKANELLEQMKGATTPSDQTVSPDTKSSSRVKREIAEAKEFMASNDSEHARQIVNLNAAREKFNTAVGYFQKRDYETAQSLLHESLELDPKNSYAYELLGDISNLNHDLVQAEQYLRQAFALNPDDILRQKLEKVLKEKQVDKTQQQYSDEHFIIRYRRNEHLAGSEIRDILREAYRNISQDFGVYPHYKIPVTLFDRQEYTQLMGSVPHWSGALFDGKIRIPVYGSTADELDLKKLIYHELTHAFILDISQSKCPVWLNEGLAQYQENKIKPIPIYMLGDAVKANALIEENDLLYFNVMDSKNQSKALVFYLESFSLISKILERYQWYHLKQLLTELGKGTSFPQAFEQVFGRSFRDFFAEWKKEITARELN